MLLRDVLARGASYTVLLPADTTRIAQRHAITGVTPHWSPEKSERQNPDSKCSAMDRGVQDILCGVATGAHLGGG